MELTICCNRTCPLQESCERNIKNIKSFSYKYESFKEYDPDVTGLDYKEIPKIFNPDIWDWNHEPMCYRANNGL